MLSKIDGLPSYPPPNFVEKVYNVVCLPEIVLYVVVLCVIAKFLKLVLERARLLEQTMYFALNFHTQNNSESLSFIVVILISILALLQRSQFIFARIESSRNLPNICSCSSRL